MELEQARLHLQALGFTLEENPSPADVKKRWKELCGKHHPDKGGNQEEFIRVTHAYSMLTDPEYRYREDRAEAQRNKKHNQYGDLNIRVQVPVSFDDAFFGRRVTVSYTRMELDQEYKPVMGGTLETITESIPLPPGSVGGWDYQIVGGGHKHNEVYGHAIVVFTPLPHPRFRVNGADVYSIEAVPLETLLRGGKIEVSTMYGLATLRVPPGTKPGTDLKIKHKGVAERGSHIIKADALFPSQDDLHGEQWAKMGINWEIKEEEDREAADYMDIFKRGRRGGIFLGEVFFK